MCVFVCVCVCVYILYVSVCMYVSVCVCVHFVTTQDIDLYNDTGITR